MRASFQVRWRGAAVVILLGALAFGLLASVRSLSARKEHGAALELEEIPSAGNALMWSADSRAPATTQQRALDELLKLLSGLAWVGFGVAAFSIISCYSAQAGERALEAGVRRAAGASRRRLLLGAAFESVVLAAIALVSGLAIGSVLLMLARHWWPGITGAIDAAGAVPALALSAVFGAAGLGSFAAVRSRHLVEPPSQEVGLRIPLLQVTVSAALLLAAVALLPRSDPSHPNPAAPSHNASMVLRVDSGLEGSTARVQAYDHLLAKLQSARGPGTVSLTSAGALLGVGTVGDLTTDCGQCYFGGIYLRWPHFGALAHAVSADTFRAEGISLLAGRSFETQDIEPSPRVAIVNRNLAQRYFQGGDAIGRALYLGPGWPNTPYRVIGIVDDSRATVIGGALQPRETVYLSVRQHPPRVTELLLEGGSALERNVLALITESLGPQSKVIRLGTRESYRAGQNRVIRWFGVSFAIMALVIS